MVTLRNASPSTSFEVDLVHEVYCAKGGPCGCANESFRQQVLDADGVAGLRPGERRVSASLRITPGGALQAHEAILELPQVLELLRRGELERVEDSALASRSTKKPAAKEP